MTQAANSLVAPDFLTLTLGLIVYFVGVIVTQHAAFLRNYNIPEPVTGGFLAAGFLCCNRPGNRLRDDRP